MTNESNCIINESHDERDGKKGAEINNFGKQGVKLENWNVL